MKTLEALIIELEKAKENTLRLLKNPEGLVDMHGLTYWAWVVERLRQEIKARI